MIDAGGPMKDILKNDTKDDLERADDPPVVARLMIEIRSDGSRTIARGAIEDVILGERATIEAKGTSPAALALSLAKSIFQMPALARGMVTRALLNKVKK